jgi:hypothetical protein
MRLSLVGYTQPPDVWIGDTLGVLLVGIYLCNLLHR